MNNVARHLLTLNTRRRGQRALSALQGQRNDHATAAGCSRALNRNSTAT